jgi:hypothetical protein
MNCHGDYDYNYYDLMFLYGLERITDGMSFCCRLFRSGE